MGEWNIYFSKYKSKRWFWPGNRDRFKRCLGEVTTAILRLDSREKLEDMLYVIEVEPNVKCT